MASKQFEWVSREKATFVTSSIGEMVVVGEPVDVGDWKGFEVQVDTLDSGAAYVSDNASFMVQTSVSLDQHARWEDCDSGFYGLGATADTGATLLRIPSVTTTVPLCKWARLIVRQGTVNPGQWVTIHAWGLLKERTT